MRGHAPPPPPSVGSPNMSAFSPLTQAKTPQAPTHPPKPLPIPYKPPPNIKTTPHTLPPIPFSPTAPLTPHNNLQTIKKPSFPFLSHPPRLQSNLAVLQPVTTWASPAPGTAHQLATMKNVSISMSVSLVSHYSFLYDVRTSWSVCINHHVGIKNFPLLT